MKRTALAALLIAASAQVASASVPVPVCPPSWFLELMGPRAASYRIACEIDMNRAVPLPLVREAPDRAQGSDILLVREYGDAPDRPRTRPSDNLKIRALNDTDPPRAFKARQGWDW